MLNLKKGQNFESEAVEFLKKRKFKILETNARAFHKEIDIICMKDNIVHFVEVKGRTNEAFGAVVETISTKKKQNLIVGAQIWLQKNKMSTYDWQIDFVGVIRGNKDKRPQITYIENAINEIR